MLDLKSHHWYRSPWFSTILSISCAIPLVICIDWPLHGTTSVSALDPTIPRPHKPPVGWLGPISSLQPVLNPARCSRLRPNNAAIAVYCFDSQKQRHSVLDLSIVLTLHLSTRSHDASDGLLLSSPPLRSNDSVAPFSPLSSFFCSSMPALDKKCWATSVLSLKLARSRGT